MRKPRYRAQAGSGEELQRLWSLHARRPTPHIIMSMCTSARGSRFAQDSPKSLRILPVLLADVYLKREIDHLDRHGRDSVMPVRCGHLNLLLNRVNAVWVIYGVRRLERSCM